MSRKKTTEPIAEAAPELDAEAAAYIAQVAHAAEREAELIKHAKFGVNDFDMQTWQFTLQRGRDRRIAEVERIASGEDNGTESVFRSVVLALL